MIPDLIRDNENVDVYRIERYFTEKAWMVVPRTLQKKENCKWFCPGCSKAIKRAENRVACERCLDWYHFPYVHLDCNQKLEIGSAEIVKQNTPKLQSVFKCHVHFYFPPQQST